MGVGEDVDVGVGTGLGVLAAVGSIRVSACAANVAVGVGSEPSFGAGEEVGVAKGPTVGVGVGAGVGEGAGVGDGGAVGPGRAVGVSVEVGVGVNVGVDVGVGSADGVAAEVNDGVAEGTGVAVSTAEGVDTSSKDRSSKYTVAEAVESGLSTPTIRADRAARGAVAFTERRRNWEESLVMDSDRMGPEISRPVPSVEEYHAILKNTSVACGSFFRT
ncbi:MAG: hypothetical protein Q8R28_19095 [Dehalococcoidia bacterium]|nr:hypothetical protein [Dehalococcoidia bacterium]